MSDWGWVTLGYVTVYGVIAAYAGFLFRRVSRARRAGLSSQGSSSGAG